MNDGFKTKKIENPTLILYEDGIPQSILVQKCRLIVIEGPDQGEEFIVDKDNFSIGALDNNEVVLKDQTISGQHCEIMLLENGYLIKDSGSTNGTLVQGIRITEAYLNQGTEVKIGKTKFIFCPLKEATEIHLSNISRSGKMIGQSMAMRKLFHRLEHYAPTDATVMIGGPTGSGKEVLAEEFHRLSKRTKAPFVVVDCTALSKGLIESELFGHTKGAFTGAHSDRKGAFEHANGGTVFLDEIADLSLDLQPKLLRVLEKKEIKPLGSNETRKVNVRIISATNKKLEAEVNAGRFREDLYYRLSVVKVELPALKKRKEDIPLLTRHFLNNLTGGEPLRNFDLSKVEDMFQLYDWPGNVRELKNAVERFYHSKDGEIDLIPQTFNKSDSGIFAGISATGDMPFKAAKSELVTRFEKEYLVSILKRNDWNVSKAAREAEIERAYLQRLIKKYDLRR